MLSNEISPNGRTDKGGRVLLSRTSLFKTTMECPASVSERRKIGIFDPNAVQKRPF